MHVPASDVGHRTLIVGRLGFPLGTLLTVQGQWERDESAKDAAATTPSLRFVATAVNGGRLDKSLRFASDLVSPLISGAFKDPPRNAGDVREIRAVEGGRFLGVPAEAYKEFAAGSQPAAAPRFEFRTEIKYVTAHVIRRGNAAGNSSTEDLGGARRS